MSPSEVARERTVPVALRFEASPGLRQSFNDLVKSKHRQLADAALYLYIAGNNDLPVIFSGIDNADDSDGAKQTINRYNHLLSVPIKGVVPYHRQFPVTGIEHFSSDDGLRINFAIHLRTTTPELNRLRSVPFDANIGSTLTLPYRQLSADLLPLPERMATYRSLRLALGRGGLYATHPTAVTLPPYVDQYSKE